MDLSWSHQGFLQPRRNHTITIQKPYNNNTKTTQAPKARRLRCQQEIAEAAYEANQSALRAQQEEAEAAYEANQSSLRVQQEEKEAAYEANQWALQVHKAAADKEARRLADADTKATQICRHLYHIDIFKAYELTMVDLFCDLLLL